MPTTEPPERPEPPEPPEPHGGNSTHGALLQRWNALLIRARTRDGESGGGGASTDGSGGGVGAQLPTTPVGESALPKSSAKGPDPALYGEDLLGRWAEPHRRYHTTAHLVAVLDRIDELAAQLLVHSPATGAFPDSPHTLPGADLDAVRLAAWFHDAVYRPDRSENEERSARLAERALPEAGVPQARTAEVARLVRLTVSHDPEPADLNGELLCDADLAILAGSPEQYAHYAAEIRQEYAFVPDPAFREGRAGVLRQLLGLPHLFRTAYARTHWEPAARHNLMTELQLLGA
jgi:predicted metal-dependent HD superfamily phosphohydrolase